MRPLSLTNGVPMWGTKLMQHAEGQTQTTPEQWACKEVVRENQMI